MATARYYATATLLNNGMVLLAGGENSSGGLVSAELYNPATGTFVAAGSMSTARYAHTATLLNNGTVLVAGGYVGGGSATAELYNPATAAFTFIGSMSVPRAGHIAKLLNNGLILVEGGYNSSGGFLATAEIFTPTSLTPPGLVSISVSPQNASILLGATQQFIAIGAFGDNSTQTLASATWSSSDGTVAAISNDGGNHGLTAPAGAGTTTITARAGPIGGSAMLRVTAPSTLVSIAVTRPIRQSPPA